MPAAKSKLRAVRPRGRAGKHPGGRPKERKGIGGVNWKAVLRDAKLGVDRDTIAVVHGFTGEQLGDPDFLSQLQQTIELGEAMHRVSLARDLARLRKSGEGSVNATLASLREKLGWDRPGSEQKNKRARPDQEAAVAELERVLRRFRAPG
jgi:hypothetical protein